jgi:hypothetical protein
MLQNKKGEGLTDVFADAQLLYRARVSLKLSGGESVKKGYETSVIIIAFFYVTSCAV